MVEKQLVRVRGWFKQIAYGTHAECTCEEFNIKTAAATFRIVLDEDRA